MLEFYQLCKISFIYLFGQEILSIQTNYLSFQIFTLSCCRQISFSMLSLNEFQSQCLFSIFFEYPSMFLPTLSFRFPVLCACLPVLFDVDPSAVLLLLMELQMVLFFSLHSDQFLILSTPNSVRMITFYYFLPSIILRNYFFSMEQNYRICYIGYDYQVIGKQSILYKTTIEAAMKREGSDINQLQKQSKTSDMLCFWGIEKFFDPKQCFRYFRKNFGDNDNITHLCKLKNKPFFLVKFNQQINCDQFNKQCSKSKRVKAKLVSEDIYDKNQIKQEDFIPIQEIKKPGQKITVQATQEEIDRVRNTKIQDIVAPLHGLSYEKQLEEKLRQINRVIENYNTQFFRDAQVKRLIKDQGKDLKPLKLDQFIQCHINRQGYRSKCQFTVGKGENGDAVVGFNKGSYHNSTIMVETPRNVNIISKSMKLIVALMENFIRTTLKNEQFEQFLPFDRNQQEGFWRYVVVRQSQRTKQSMIIVVCKTQGFGEEKTSKIKESLVNYLKSAIIGLKSLCFLSYNGQADSIPPQKPTLLWGEPFYQQKIFDHTFQVSPSAFLQIHIDMCQILYQKIIDYVKQCEIILDLGCGIGTIGISIMNKIPNVKVIGVQICQQAVEDAKKNYPNYEIHLGRAQEKIKTICDEHRGKRIVAILDPPRAGFNKEVMLALRRCRGLDSLIYVACNAGAIQDNLLQLTLPTTNKRKAPQFLITKMFGFDLFPQTNHFQALYVMERRQY